MEGYLLDNNTLNYWHNASLPQHPFVDARIRALPRDTLLRTSVVVLGEIEDGHRRVVGPSPDQQARQEALRKFIRDKFPEPLAVTRDTVEFYGEIRSRIFRHCYPRGKGPKRPECWLAPATAKELGIEENDLWIASQAAEHGLVFITHDGMANIRMVVNGLVEIDDWAEP